MKIKNIEKFLEDYYPKKEKIKRTKPRKKDLVFIDKSHIVKQNKK
jgi:hypothetical protein|tara:strand:+ start:230 stop:364 length:135 start_codon:yes stop_codon:yes gene_type:complete